MKNDFDVIVEASPAAQSDPGAVARWGEGNIVTIISDAGSKRVAIDELLVAFDLAGDTAHIVFGGPVGLRWTEVPRADAELLVAMGARGHVDLVWAPYSDSRERKRRDEHER